MSIDKIYLVYENSDTTEGRGPMRIVSGSGFFTDENEAWKFADTIPGVMGHKPASGSWRREKYSDVEVRCFYKHAGKNLNRQKEIKDQMEALRKELRELEKE